MSDAGDESFDSSRQPESPDLDNDDEEEQQQEEEEQQQPDEENETDETQQPEEQNDVNTTTDAPAESTPINPDSSPTDPIDSTPTSPDPFTQTINQSHQQPSESNPISLTTKPHEEMKESSPPAPISPLEHVLSKVHSTVSTGMQSDEGGEETANGEDETETANASGQTGEEQLESLEQDQSEEAQSARQHQQQANENVQELPVEITIMPDGFKHMELFSGADTIGQIKAILSDRFKLDPRQMRLALGDLVLEDDRLLQEYREFDVSRMVNQGIPLEELQSRALSFVLNIELDESDAAQQAQQNGQPKEEYKMPDIIKVVINREELELEAEEEEEKEMNGETGGRSERTPEQVVYVQVIRDNLHHPKPFLGGFRHKYFGTIYHHSSTQTARKKKKVEVVKFHRETQTIQIISRSQQTNREAGTQMERRDLLQDHSNDVVIMSKPYFTADELEALRDEKAREVQCFLRQCFAWRRVRRLRESKAEKLDAILKAQAKKAKEEAEDHARQIQRRMHPRTKEDFTVLFKELEAWRLHETQRIKESGLSAEEIAAALQELLNKEVKLLQTIDRLKITAAKENKWSRTQVSLEKMASPKEWSSSEGDLIEVETPFTTRAKELVDLYNGLCLRNLSRSQRVDVLLHIKYTVKEFDCELSREIVELIKREEDLLRRQRSEASLEGLRKRLQNLFLQFVNTPHFNPEAANFQRAQLDGGMAQPPPALSSSLAKPAMLTKTNTITVASNVAGRIFAEKSKK